VPDQGAESLAVIALDALLKLGVDVHGHLRVAVADLARGGERVRRLRARPLRWSSSSAARSGSRRRPNQRATGQRSARAVEDERLLERIRALHAENHHAYGARRVWKALLREGEQVGRDRVARLMRGAGIQGAKRRGNPWRTTTTDPGAARRPDLVERNFSATGPNALWVADLTYLRCWERLVFFAFVIDAYSRRVVGWQFAAGSVGSVGDAYDNALAESFVDSFKTELIADRVWRDRAQLDSRSSSGSPGSTPPGCTNRSAMSRRSNSRPSGTRCARWSGPCCGVDG